MKSKLSRTLVAGLLLGVTALLPAFGQSVYVVTITDMQKKQSYEVMTREQVAELKSTIQAESRHFQAAIAAARKDWESNDLTKDKPFRTTGLAPRKFRQEGPFSQEAARKKADRLLERDVDREYNASRAKSGRSRGKLSEKEVKKQERELMREQAAQEAADLIKKHLDALVKGGR